MPTFRTIDEVVQAFKRGQIDGDPAAVAALFTEDAVLYPPVAAPVLRGRAAIQRMLEAFHGAMRILDEGYDDVARDVSGDVGYVHWRYWVRLQPRAANAPETTTRGRALWVLRRGRDDDGWRIAVDHASVDPQQP